MKKCCIALLLLLCAGFSLSAQSNSNVFIFFPSVTGVGHSRGDNAAIARMLTDELASRNYTLLNTPQGADFTLYGSLGIFDEYADYESRYDNRIQATTTYTFNAPMREYYGVLYLFQLILRNDKTGEVILQNVVYASFDDVYNFFPVLMNNLFTHIPGNDKLVNLGDWLDKYLYLGVNAFWSPRIYYGDSQSAHFVNFGGGVSAEYYFWKYLSFEAGAQLVPDWVVHSDDNYQNLMLEIPVALRVVLKLSDHYMLGPYAGAQINIPLYEPTKTPLFSWMIGITGGVRAGPGIFYIEPRYAMDIGNSSIKTGFSATPFEYQRYLVHIGIGYKFGFFTKQ
jgi:hypothetical protein